MIKSGYEVLSAGRQADEQLKIGPSISDLLYSMETLRVEFKETARVAKRSEIPESVINEGVIKTVAAATVLITPSLITDSGISDLFATLAVSLNSTLRVSMEYRRSLIEGPIFSCSSACRPALRTS